jgi:hypothetical protein
MANSGGPRRATSGPVAGRLNLIQSSTSEVGQVNYQHVDVCLGEGACSWSDLSTNVAKNFRFGFKDYPFYDGYLGWGP